MRRHAFASVASITLLAFTFAPSAPAAASREAWAEANSATACSITAKSDTGTITVREAPDETSQFMGLLSAGKAYAASCKPTTAWTPTAYTLCGGTSTWWAVIEWNSEMGFVPLQCVSLVSS
ncbi:hypothetical protein [Actinomadura opuntiae]|uniref:hypothetical protein n=1 Tax=Actinomadura sp. OS1-43 TaxID=604315 RepID=UPI00255B0800|nr:hypothetical protein [Actinomadura sp. OS1-43]